MTAKYHIAIDPARIRITPKLPDDVLDKLGQKLRYRVHGYQFTDKYQQGFWDGYKKLFYRRTQTAHSGCFSVVRKLLENEGYSVEYSFKYNYEPIGKGIVKNIPGDGKLYDDQIDAGKKAVVGRYGIIEAPMRSGKTAIIAWILDRIQQYPSIVITNGADIVRQTYEDLKVHLPAVSIGYFSESKFVPGDITVMSYQAVDASYTKRKKQSQHLKDRNAAVHKLMQQAKVLILDECHHIYSRKRKKILLECGRVGYRIGLSGTPRPSNITSIEAEATLGPTIKKIPFKRLIAKKRLAQPKIIMYHLPTTWYRYDLPNYKEEYQSNIVENERRNKFIVRVINELQKQGKTAYVTITSRDHGKKLNELIQDSVYVHGQISTSVRSVLYDRINKKDLSCIIATVSKEGLNLPTLDAVVVANGLKELVATFQRMRSLTKHDKKKFGLIIDFFDRGKYTAKHSKKRLKLYNSVDGFIVQERTIKRGKYE